MRKIRWIIIFLLLSIKSFGQEYSSYYKGKKQEYGLSKTKLIITYNRSTDPERSLYLLSKERISHVDHGSNMKTHIVSFESEVDKIRISKIVQEVEEDEAVSFASPVLLSQHGQEIGGVTDRFIVQLKPKLSKSDIMKLDIEQNLIITAYEFDSRTFIISVPKGSLENCLNTANRFYESGLFEFSEPDFLLFVYKSTSDPYFNQQWALTSNSSNTGGMSVTDAWSITTGCSSVKVAILDDGVELTHPDLITNLLSGYDATGGGSLGGPDDGGNHGTACAGIVGSVSNNVGTAGVAYNSRLVPIRIANSFSDAYDLTTAIWEASGIDWAWQNGASILSMSWFTIANQSGIDAAINRAVTQGRNGLGSVIFASTGNTYNSTIVYPSSNSQTIAVGASVAGGSKADFSNYGTGLDLVAPGVNIYTTDRTGNLGYVPGDYISNFSGTSAACPNAAGVMALILSVNPTLTYSQARQVLESSTDKNTSYTFTTVSGQPNGTWNDHVGYGSVNAKKAIALLTGGNISGPSLVCSSSSYSIINNQFISGANVTWSTTNSSGLSFDDPHVGTASRKNNYNGMVSVLASIGGSCGGGTSPLIPLKAHVGAPSFKVKYDGVTPASIDGSVPQSYTATPPNHTVVADAFTTGTTIGHTTFSVLLVTQPSDLKNVYLDDSTYMFSSKGTVSSFFLSFVASNSCGSNSGLIYFCNNNCNGGAQAPIKKASTRLSVSPIPATDMMLLEVNDSTNAEAYLDQPYQLIIFDKYSKKVFSTYSSEKILEIPVSNLPSDIYYLKLLFKDAVLQKQIVIGH